MKKYFIETIYRGINDPRIRTKVTEYDHCCECARYIDNMQGRRDIEDIRVYRCERIDPHACHAKSELEAERKIARRRVKRDAPIILEP